MTDLDRALRATMAHRAADAPRADGLMTAVLDRGRRQRRRRLIAGVLSLALIVGGGVVGTAVVWHPDEDRTLQITDGRAPWPDPAPIRPGWLPDGFDEPRVLYLRPGTWGFDSYRTSPRAWLSVDVMSREPELRRGPGERRAVEVDGADATLYWVPTHALGDPKYGTEPPESMGPFGELTYQRRAGQWVRIAASNDEGGSMGLTEADLVEIAENLTDEKQPVADVVRMTLPPGTEVGRVEAGGSRATLVLVDAGAPDEPVSLAEWPGTLNTGEAGPTGARMTVLLTRSDDPELTRFNTSNATSARQRYEDLTAPVKLPPGGALFRDGSSVWYLHPLPGHDRMTIAIRAGSTDPLATADTLRSIAESVRPGPDAKFPR
ncbi:hypothetical protein [Cryptosporangium arvum]|uniref:Uncharacterized protein n=1 Tax=Cryptosporangium arvum DSM 44712 TaxID=927661 RepID=A0A010YNQ0_9ACTN|nr:hypothetical protein [Cryptosporangium arvum]EXG81785.1 hypothetical protein CryarDRAFT_2905 [Cryptosporangium arvum DSM 44712]